MFEGPARPGFVLFWVRTATATGCHIFTKWKKPVQSSQIVSLGRLELRLFPVNSSRSKPMDRAKGACAGQPVQVTMWMRTSSDDWYVSTNMCMYLRCHVTWSGDGSGDGWRVARGHYSTDLYYCTISINSAVTHHKASGYGRNPSLVPGHRSTGHCQKTIGQKGQNSLFFFEPYGQLRLSIIWAELYLVRSILSLKICSKFNIDSWLCSIECSGWN